MHGLGAVAPEDDEPVFHADWEGRVLAMVIASPTRGNIDAGRHQRELIPGSEYLGMSYYERWFAGLVAMLLGHGIISDEELTSGSAEGPRASPRLLARDTPAALERQGSYLRDTPGSAAFAPGDRVRARNLNPEGHTRLPRYARGRVGVIEARHGSHVFPDSHAHGSGEDPRPLYTVRFTAQELWGPKASARDSVSLDLWEPYLERA
jgi:nitrile hydratase